MKPRYEAIRGRGLRAAATAGLAVLALWLSACGPFGYIGKVTRAANRSMAQAEALGAEQSAPYEYYGAKAYLEQARLMMSYSEFERAFDYGARAKQLADAATKTAQRVQKGESVQRAEEEGEGDSADEGSTSEAGADQ